MPRVLMIGDFDKNGNRKGVNDEGVATLICALRKNGVIYMHSSSQTYYDEIQLYSDTIQMLSEKLLKELTIDEFMEFQARLFDKLGV